MDRLTHDQAVAVRRIAAAAIRMLGPETEIGGSITDEVEHVRANLDHVEQLQREQGGWRA